MSPPEYLKLLEQGVEAWNLWRVSNPLVRPNFNFASLKGAQLAGAYLRDVILGVADLESADLSGANLNGADLVGAFLRRANLRQANLSDANLFQANLTYADLRGANLREANLDQANLRGADLRQADLRRSRLRAADLNGANLAGANLGEVNLTGASLAEASLRGANLSGADLSTADLRSTNFAEATIGWTKFSDLDLGLATGLESVVHLGPSSVGLDTVFRCGLDVPDLFLQGVGLPDIFLTYMSSLLGQAVQFFACFIRCSADDRRFGQRLYADLRAKGIRTWFLPENPESAPRSVWSEIDQTIKVYDQLVLVCSETSLRNARILTDLDQALDKERSQGKPVLYPVRLDDYVSGDWQHNRKPAVLDRPIEDFRGWEHSADTYDASFTELLERLGPPAMQPRGRRRSSLLGLSGGGR